MDLGRRVAGRIQLTHASSLVNPDLILLAAREAERVAAFPALLTRTIVIGWPRRWLVVRELEDGHHAWWLSRIRARGAVRVSVHPAAVGTLDGSPGRRPTRAERSRILALENVPRDSIRRPLEPVRLMGRLVGYRGTDGRLTWRRMR